MKSGELSSSSCALEHALAVVGDRWVLKILRDAFLGVRRFDHFQGRLGAARNVLSDRLARLVEYGILAKTAYQDRPVRYEYRLTVKGHGLFPVILSLASWSEHHFAQPQGPAITFIHRECGHGMHPVLACSECGGALDAHGVDLGVDNRVGRGATAWSVLGQGQAR